MLSSINHIQNNIEEIKEVLEHDCNAELLQELSEYIQQFNIDIDYLLIQIKEEIIDDD